MKMWEDFKKGWEGFTLIEMMIVIAFLGIIAAIAIPRFVAKDRKDMNPLQQLNQSKMNYQSNDSPDANINIYIQTVSDELIKLPVGYYRIEGIDKIISIKVEKNN